MNTSHWKRLGLVLFGAMTVVAGCGKPQEEDTNVTAMEVNGSAYYGTQCPSGFVRDPSPVALFLRDCPIKVQSMGLVEPIEGLVFQADCVSKSLTVRSNTRGKLDTAWSVLPDGSFYVQIDGQPMTLTTDGAGHSNCQTPTTLEIWGKIQCPSDPAKQDKAVIDVKTAWNLGKQGTRHITLGNACSFPQTEQGCYLIASSSLNQCSN